MTYPDPRPKFPLALATLKPGLQQLVVDAARGDIYAIAKEQGGSVIVRYEPASGLSTPIVRAKGIGNSIGYGGHSYDVYDGQIAVATEDKAIALLAADGVSFKTITPRYEGIACPRFFAGPNGATRLLFVAQQGERQQVMFLELGEDQGQPVPLSEPTWFIFDPVLSADGRHLAWQEWDSHQMPFIESAVIVATLEEGAAGPRITSTTAIAHDGRAVGYPQFSPDGQTVAFCSDHEGRRQIYTCPLHQADRAEAIAISEGEVGDPSWVYGQQPFRFSDDQHIVWRHSVGLSDRLMLTSLADGHSKIIHDQQSAIAELVVGPRGIGFIAERSDMEPQLFFATAPSEDSRPVLTSKRGGYAPSILQKAERLAITFDGGHQTDGLYMPPRRGPGQNNTYPLVVVIHGGPTARVAEQFRAQWQYLASHGVALLAINHRGSTGYGRDFQDLLEGQWGIVDVADAKAAAEQALAAHDELDPNRLFIMGGSAGGYTTLMALATDPDFWAGGICLYGIADLIKLADTTHPFERPYNHHLLGADDGTSWWQRSPAAHKITTPVRIFHGSKDKAVPIGPMQEFQAQLFASGNRDAQLTVFPDEGHGFRRADNLETLLTETLEFVASTTK